MLKNILWSTLFAIIGAILQSTLLARFAIQHATPDLALMILVFCAYNNGSMTGQLTGFLSGFLLDFLSAAPLGLNAFMRTIIGATMGLMGGLLILDAVFLPMLLCAIATVFKALLLFVLHIFFSEGVPAYPMTEPLLIVELGFNTLLAPLLFALLNRFKGLLVREIK